MFIIKANELEKWTDSEPRRAQELLPKLIWKLIMETSRTITDIHFPFEKAIQYNGYDGYLVTDDEMGFYPSGTSVWEFGTDKDIKSKFNSDYDKRSNDPNGIDSKTTTFCFVSSRIWNHREGITEFTQKKIKEKTWKNVRIYDANSLEMWLSKCPATTTWLLEIMGRPAKGLTDAEDYWDYTTDATPYRLTNIFFTYNPCNFANQLKNLYDKKTKNVLLLATSEIEGILSLLADLKNDNSNSSKRLLSKIVIATSREGFENVCSEYHDCIVIPIINVPGSVLNTNNLVLKPTEKNGAIDLRNKNVPRLTVPDWRRKNFHEAMVSLGYRSDEADTMLSDFKCRFAPFYRNITNNMNYKMPTWMNFEEQTLEVMIPALLANEWETNYSGDAEILSILSGKSYDDYKEGLEKSIVNSDLPIYRLNTTWGCIYVKEIWDILAKSITSTYLQRYLSSVRQVFSECDPTYELPEENWQFA